MLQQGDRSIVEPAVAETKTAAGPFELALEMREPLPHTMVNPRLIAKIGNPLPFRFAPAPRMRVQTDLIPRLQHCGKTWAVPIDRPIGGAIAIFDLWVYSHKPIEVRWGTG